MNYGNLRYACASCNSKKAARRLPGPLTVLASGAVEVEESGEIKGTTPDADRRIKLLELDEDEEVMCRRLMTENIRLAATCNPDLSRRLMGFPDDLPDLSGSRPPVGNSRPEGIAESHSARRQRGELPDPC